METSPSQKPPQPHDKHRFWQEHVSRWQASNTSQVAYCKQANINYQQFVYWLSKHRRRSQAPAVKKKKLLPVSINSIPSSSIRIRLANQTVIEIPASLPAAQLCLIIQSLELHT